MRKYQPPTQSLVTNPEWLATMNFVESTLYPTTDPVLARDVGTVSDINYRTVYETVFFGNDQIPGLYSQVVAPVDVPQIQQPPTDQIVETISKALEGFSLTDSAKGLAQGLLMQAQTTGKGIQDALSRIGPGAQLSAGVVADIGIKILEPIGWTEQKRSAFKKIVGQAWDKITKEGVQPGPGTSVRPSGASSTSTSPFAQSGFVPESEAQYGRGATTAQQTAALASQRQSSSSKRMTDLANGLVRLVQHQSFAQRPLGFTDEDFVTMPSEELQKVLANQAKLQTEFQIADTDTARTKILNDIMDLETQAAELRASGAVSYISRPGRGPTTKTDQIIIDYTRRLQADPSKYTVDAIRQDARMLAEMRKMPAMSIDAENFMSAGDIGPTLRQYSREGKLPDLYERLSRVMPSWNFNNVLDINGIDDYTENKVAEFTASAQRLGLTMEEYLNQLSNDPQHLSRVQEMRSNAGGSRPAIRLPSDDDLTSVFKYVSQATIGRTLPKEVYQSMIEAYKPQLVRFQQQLQGGGTVTEPPQAETFAESQIEQQFGQEKFTYKLGGFLNELSKLAGGGM
jgi:hypothetical protein